MSNNKILNDKIENTLKIIDTLDSDVVSLIGVLEHLQEPVQVL